MPFNNELTIAPATLQIILNQLKAISWSQGPVIIRDLVECFEVRDTSDGHIFSLVKNEDPHEEPG